MSFLFDESYYKIGKNGVSPAQNMCAYLGGSAIQTVGDNPVTAYRQLVQQYAKDVNGNTVAPKVAVGEANATFRANPIGASLSGLWPRLVGVLLKRVPKFGFLLGYSHFVGEGTPGFAAATCASASRRGRSTPPNLPLASARGGPAPGGTRRFRDRSSSPQECSRRRATPTPPRRAAWTTR